MEYSLSLQMSSSSHRPTTAEDMDEHNKHIPHWDHSLHSIRKPPAKPWRRPELPPPPKVYRVDPHGFRRLVQKLTGMPQSSAAARSAPPPIRVDHWPVPSTQQPQQPAVNTDGMGAELPSPSSFYNSSWFNFPLLSPGSIAALES